MAFKKVHCFFEPKHSDDKSRAVIRSMISSDYANRFIKMYLM